MPTYAHPGVSLAYGTAGFRAKAELLDSTFFRMGALAVLRSRSRDGMAIGLMVTASHNAEPDNGIKLIDPDGGMLDVSWEVHATALANAPDDSALLGSIAAVAAEVGLEELPADELKARLAAAEGAAVEPMGAAAQVFIAMDTRPHSARLAKIAAEGVRFAGGECTDYGELTTPQLHHIVKYANGEAASGKWCGPKEWASEPGYYDMLTEAYTDLVPDDKEERCNSVVKGTPYMIPFERNELVVDGSCGIGAPKAAKLAHLLPLRVVNGVSEGPLNSGVGAEYVQKGKVPPRGLESPPEGCPPCPGLEDGAPHPHGTEKIERCASLDGDADRMVYHYWRAVGNGKPTGGEPVAHEWRLLDGDKIAALMTSFVNEQLTFLDLPPISRLHIGVVQTAYANGASTDWFRRNITCKITTTKTGVKHVHAAAAAHVPLPLKDGCTRIGPAESNPPPLNMDISIYFEANGHGSILFSDRAVLHFHAAKAQAQSEIDHVEPPKLPKGVESLCARNCPAGHRLNAANNLLALRQLASQATGDGLCNFLIIEAILTRRGWTMSKFDGLYEDYPSRQTKLKVADRNAIQCNDNETETTQPPGLQPALNNLSEQYEGGRCFVRPSGTEDVVRVYAEATTQYDADQLALRAAQEVWQRAGGMGDKPTKITA